MVEHAAEADRPSSRSFLALQMLLGPDERFGPEPSSTAQDSVG